jgi:ribulose-phosphate 3-epimerase
MKNGCRLFPDPQGPPGCRRFIGLLSKIMTRTLRIAPSLLSADFSRLGEEVKALCTAGADYIHVDIMDGHYVPNLTVGPLVIRAIKPHATKPLDVHLMIAPVDPYITAFTDAGADIVTFHPDAGPHPHRTIQLIRNGGAKAGLALNPGTPVEAVTPLIEDIALILVMSVNPGFGGQRFIPSQLEKIRRLRDIIDSRNLDCEIEVDGGINGETAALAIAAGANVLVAGTASFAGGPERYAQNIALLRGA